MASGVGRTAQLEDRPVVRPTTLGQFVALDSCPQFFSYEFDEGVATQRRQEKPWKEAFEPLSLLLATEGREFESAAVTELEEVAHEVIDHGHLEDWDESRRELQAILERVQSLAPGTGPVLITQPRFGMQIEAWPIAGDADVVAIWSTVEGIRLRILDVKAAHEEKTYQQVQVAVYTLLCRQFLEDLSPDYSWEIEGGIVHRETEFSNAQPEAFPSFSLETRELDVRRLLRRGGRFDQLWNRDPASIRYRLAPKCHHCTYKEACYTDSIENRKPALLGLRRGEQESLAKHDIDTIEDLASLAYPPSDPRPYEYEDLKPTDQPAYEALVSEPGIGERLPRYIQEAQALLGELSPDHMFAANTTSRAPWLLGSGNGDLPEDDPPFDDAERPFERRSMVRCYLHVEWDHRRDRVVMLSAHVTSTRLEEERDGSPKEVSSLARSLPTAHERANAVEAELMEAFFSDLFEASNEVAERAGCPEEAPVHWYLYSGEEREALEDAVERHDAIPEVAAARDLLGLRASIDQAMVSIVRSEVEHRVALPVNNTGLLPVMDYLRPSQGFFPQTDWTYSRSDGTEIDLRDAFDRRLFDYRVPYAENEPGIDLYPEDDPDGFYPSRARQGARIPLEYVWAALGRLTPEWLADDRGEDAASQSIAAFQWVDPDERTTRIEREDLSALGVCLARCVQHVERGLTYRNASVPKEPLPLGELAEFSLGENDLARAATDYLHLEHSSQRRDLLARFGLPVEQRIRRGDAIPVLVRSAEETDDGSLVVEGHLLYDRLFEDGDRVAGACRHKGPAGATGGSWLVANELDRQGEPVESSRPRDIERGPGVTIEELDIQNRSIRFSAIDTYLPHDRTFRRRHRGWTTDPAEEDEQTQCFEPNRVLVLDPRTDDLTAQRTFELLDSNSGTNACRSVEALATGDVTRPRTTAFSAAAIESFLGWLVDAFDPAPNESQQAFIRDGDSQYALLQGPPGTGKTSGALANAVVARVAGLAATNQQCFGVVAGESNKAVDEVLADTATVCEAYRSDPTTDDAFDRLRLVRVTGKPPDDPLPGVDYLDYYADKDALADLAERLLEGPDGQQRFGDFAGTSLPHVIVFATPSRLYGLIDAFDINLDETRSPTDWLDADASFFDFLAVDEASMMRLPSFLLCQAFLHDHAQVLIAGDHRQLPPVQQHDWDAERRRTITEFAPSLSTLDFFRAVTGHNVPGSGKGTKIAGSASLPWYQLSQTYRCHPDVVGVLQRHVYAADDISFRSRSDLTLRSPARSSDPVSLALDPDYPLVLVVHGERSSQQANLAESVLAASLVSSVGVADETGIVTPHNAQRGLLSSVLDDGTEVETVERYQGGERDCIVVSATASDPDFLAAEQDFILNPNRLNVAMSRMKRKLVVLASEAVFELIPPEVEQYERAGLWKALYDELDVLETTPAWRGDLDEFAPSTPGAETAEVPVAIYRFERSE